MAEFIQCDRCESAPVRGSIVTTDDEPPRKVPGRLDWAIVGVTVHGDTKHKMPEHLLCPVCFSELKQWMKRRPEPAKGEG